MPKVPVARNGRIVIRAGIGSLLGITPGIRLGFATEGKGLLVDVVRRAARTYLEDGYGLLDYRRLGKRRLAEFEVAEAMRKRGN
jgi:bifunctional DNA-binding transcriptional regulator/antitoxin component of YhaV-PrlF toxin-antitoxin module